MNPSTSPVYEPHDLAVMSEAFECSYQRLVLASDRRLKGRHDHYTREIIAKLVIGHMQRGERDSKAICNAVAAQMDVINGQ